MRKLELREKLEYVHTGTKLDSNFDVTKHIRMAPPFQERDVDKYFLHFEKWPKENWTMLLQSILVGKARDIYAQLLLDIAAENNTVKELILKGYELVHKAYHQKFRNFEKKVRGPI